MRNSSFPYLVAVFILLFLVLFIINFERSLELIMNLLILWGLAFIIIRIFLKPKNK